MFDNGNVDSHVLRMPRAHVAREKNSVLSKWNRLQRQNTGGAERRKTAILRG